MIKIGTLILCGWENGFFFSLSYASLAECVSSLAPLSKSVTGDTMYFYMRSNTPIRAYDLLLGDIFTVAVRRGPGVTDPQIFDLYL